MLRPIEPRFGASDKASASGAQRARAIRVYVELHAVFVSVWIVRRVLLDPHDDLRSSVQGLASCSLADRTMRLHYAPQSQPNGPRGMHRTKSGHEQ